MSIILTSEFVSRLIRNLHNFDLLKFTLVERSTSGNRMTLDVTRNGRRMSKLYFKTCWRMETPRHSDLDLDYEL